MRTLLLLIVVALALGVAFVPVAPAQAQDNEYYSEPAGIFWDIQLADCDTSGSDWVKTCSRTFDLPLPNDDQLVGFSTSTTVPTYTQNIRFSFVYENASTSSQLIYFENGVNNINPPGCYNLGFLSGAGDYLANTVGCAELGFNTGWVDSYAWGTAATYESVRQLKLIYRVNCPNNNCSTVDFSPLSVSIDDLIWYGDGQDIVRPLTEPDEQDLGYSIGSGSNSVISDINNWGTSEVFTVLGEGSSPHFVHAAVDGVVWDIQPFTIDQCRSNDGLACEFAGLGLFSMQPDDLSIVSILDGDTLYEYLVANAETYITVDSSVSEGCILGETIPVEDAVEGPKTFTLMRSVEQTGYVPIADWTDQLVVYPNNDAPCSDVEGGCLNANSSLIDDLGGWSLGGGAQYVNTGGVLLGTGANITQSLFGLDDTITYTVTLVTQGTGELRVSLGAAYHIAEVSSAPGEVTTTYVDLTPDSPNVTLRVQAENNLETIYVLNVCLDYQGKPASPSSACFFSNASFQDGLMGWAYTNPVGTGYNDTLRLGHGGQISQRAALNTMEDGSPATYRLAIEFSYMEDYAENAYINYSWNGVGALLKVPDVSAPEIFQNGLTTYTVDLEVATSGEDAFTFAAIVEDGTNTPTDDIIVIRKVCLLPPEGETAFPGYVTAPTTGAICEAVEQPATFDVWGWILWLWRSMRNWFDCVLVPLLQGMWQSMSDAYYLLNDSIAYGVLWGDGFIGMLLDFLWVSWGWLGNFWQIAIEIVWGLLQSLAIVLWQVGSIIYRFGIEMYVLVADLYTRYGNLRNAWNTIPPVHVPGTDCTSQIEPTTLFCKSIWAIDNTLLADNAPGYQWIRIVAAWVSGHILIWFIRLMKRTFISGAAST